MPRKRELTWQPGADGRSGRWRKKYRGRVLYFACGASKSDPEGYRLAVEAWRRKKEEIDAEENQKPKPNQEQYEAAIKDWQYTLQWARANGEDEFARLASEKIKVLQERLAKANPQPLAWGDRWQDQFDVPPDVVKSILDTLDSASANLDIRSLKPSDFKSRLGRPREKGQTEPDVIDPMVPLPEVLAREIWADRIEHQRRQAGRTDDTVSSGTESFLAVKRAEVDSGTLSAGRYDPLRVHLHHFRDWLGGSLPVKSITGKVIADYYSELMRGIRERDWSADYAKDRFNAVKSFVRWLWTIDLIDLPRNLDSRTFKIRKRIATPQVFTREELNRLMACATERTRLYLLLMLNCGMTQKDISDLRQSELDWERGTITRRRSKTAHHESVPTVTYKLWPETLRLLRQERTTTGDLVLVNEDGGPLKIEELADKGTLRKIDNVASAFSRLKRATGINKPIKLLRKTSATLLRSKYEYAGIESLFLGHSPRSMADRHYAAAPQDLLDQAVEWLGRELGLA